jgi:hypothetical protein
VRRIAWHDQQNKGPATGGLSLISRDAINKVVPWGDLRK